MSGILGVRKKLARSKYLYILISFPIIYFVVFKYVPMYGLIIAFKDYKVYQGYWGSSWVGLKHFQNYLSDPNFWVLLKNTLLLSLYQIIFVFPVPIVFALMLNELRFKRYKALVQNISYLPHFISVVVVASMISTFVANDGIINDIVAYFGFERTSFLLQPGWFRPVYILSEIWQNTGWSAIIYLAALSNCDMQLYEAARIDGAGRWKQLIHITFPVIVPTITILLILQVGQILSVSFEKVLLLQNPLTYQTSDIISTYVYRRGLQGAQYSYAAAIDFFSSIVNLIVLLAANTLSRKISDTSLW